MKIKEKLAAMSPEQMRKALLEVHDILYTEIDGDTITENPDKEWDDETLNSVADALQRSGLTPEELIEYPSVE